VADYLIELEGAAAPLEVPVTDPAVHPAVAGTEIAQLIVVALDQLRSAKVDTYAPAGVIECLDAKSASAIPQTSGLIRTPRLESMKIGHCCIPDCVADSDPDLPPLRLPKRMVARLGHTVTAITRQASRERKKNGHHSDEWCPLAFHELRSANDDQRDRRLVAAVRDLAGAAFFFAAGLVTRVEAARTGRFAAARFGEDFADDFTETFAGAFVTRAAAFLGAALVAAAFVEVAGRDLVAAVFVIRTGAAFVVVAVAGT
jgi:hypothetical protein